jgi:hypothetical protein
MTGSLADRYDAELRRDHERFMAAMRIGRSDQVLDALSAAGASLPAWLVLISLKAQRLPNQRQIAACIAIQGATLTQLPAKPSPSTGRVRALVRRSSPSADAESMRISTIRTSHASESHVAYTHHRIESGLDLTQYLQRPPARVVVCR